MEAKKKVQYKLWTFFKISYHSTEIYRNSMSKWIWDEFPKGNQLPICAMNTAKSREKTTMCTTFNWLMEFSQFARDFCRLKIVISGINECVYTFVHQQRFDGPLNELKCNWFHNLQTQIPLEKNAPAFSLSICVFTQNWIILASVVFVGEWDFNGNQIKNKPYVWAHFVHELPTFIFLSLCFTLCSGVQTIKNGV